MAAGGRHALRSGSEAIHKIALSQMTSTSDVSTNLKTCLEHIKKAANEGAKMLFLPECCLFVGGGAGKKPQLTIDGPEVQAIQNAAQLSDIWVSVGGFPAPDFNSQNLVPGKQGQAAESASEKQFKVFNSQLIVGGSGAIVSQYSKVHLFDADVKNGPVLQESSYTSSGNCLTAPVQTPVGIIGLQICYDLRFPQAAMALREAGANVITYPSAFTVPTGKAHWEILLRARAIETQCWVIASAQVGEHSSKRRSYGHSMVIDPWGQVVLDAGGAKESLCFADIDHGVTSSVRSRMPIIDHLRPDAYHCSET